MVCTSAGKPNCKRRTTCCTSATPVWGEPAGVNLGVYKNDGLQAGKLRPRGYKDLPHTSQSGSFLVTEPGLELRIRLGQSSVLVLRPDKRPLLSCCESLVPNPSSRMCSLVRALCPLAARNSSFLYLQLLKASMASDGSDVSSTNTPCVHSAFRDGDTFSQALGSSSRPPYCQARVSGNFRRVC